MYIHIYIYTHIERKTEKNMYKGFSFIIFYAMFNKFDDL